MAAFICSTLVVSGQEGRHLGDILPPTLVKRVDATYTDAARTAKIEGSVVVDAVVLTNGTVGDVSIVQSLDTRFGLDEQALKASKQWLFKPATKNGQPVSTHVRIEQAFHLSSN